MFAVFFGWLASWTGEPLNIVLSMLSHVAILPIVWGLWWTMVIQKAGFRGAAFWRLFGFIVAPVMLYPIADGILGHDEIASTILAIWSGVCISIGILLITFLPWPTQRHSKLPNLFEIELP
ncbi:MAG: hypothetical protein AAFW84_07810 [Cyanobacteria bacterium J06635_15]